MSEDNSRITKSLHTIQANAVRSFHHKELMKAWKRGHSAERRYVLLAQLLTATVGYYTSFLVDAETSLMDRDALLQRLEGENVELRSELQQTREAYATVKSNLTSAEEDIDRLEAEKSELSLKLAKREAELRDTRKALASKKKND